jgi:flagellar basal-body rod protein FlgC
MNTANLFPAIQIAGSSLQAERLRMEVAANNLANANSTRGADGRLYQRQTVLFSAVYEESLGGVEVDGVVPENRAPIKSYAPYHPAADQDGMVEQANVSTIEEMMDIISASRAYQSSLSALKQSREMAQRTINIGQGK